MMKITQSDGGNILILPIKQTLYAQYSTIISIIIMCTKVIN